MADITITSLPGGSTPSGPEYIALDQEGSTVKLSLSDLFQQGGEESITSLSFNNNTLTYTDESGSSTNIDLSQLEDTLTSLSFANSTLSYTDEDGSTIDIPLDDHFLTLTQDSIELGNDWDTNSPYGGDKLYIKDMLMHSDYDPYGTGADVDGNDNYALSKNRFPLIISDDDDSTDGPNSHGIVLYNASGTAGSFAPSILFASRETGTTDYRAAAAGIYCRSPIGEGGASGGSNYSDGELIFATSGVLTETTTNSQGVTQRMVIDRAGKVGINVIAPTEILDIDGNALVSGNINSGGNVIASTAAGDISFYPSEYRVYANDSATHIGIYTSPGSRGFAGIINNKTGTDKGGLFIGTRDNNGDEYAIMCFNQLSDDTPTEILTNGRAGELFYVQSNGNVAAAGDITATGNVITSTPTSENHAATKDYVDGLIRSETLLRETQPAGVYSDGTTSLRVGWETTYDGFTNTTNYTEGSFVFFRRNINETTSNNGSHVKTLTDGRFCLENGKYNIRGWVYAHDTRQNIIRLARHFTNSDTTLNARGIAFMDYPVIIEPDNQDVQACFDFYIDITDETLDDNQRTFSLEHGITESNNNSDIGAPYQPRPSMPSGLNATTLGWDPASTVPEVYSHVEITKLA